jgi:hypothetical protein
MNVVVLPAQPSHFGLYLIAGIAHRWGDIIGRNAGVNRLHRWADQQVPAGADGLRRRPYPAQEE